MGVGGGTEQAQKNNQNQIGATKDNTVIAWYVKVWEYGQYDFVKNNWNYLKNDNIKTLYSGNEGENSLDLLWHVASY